MSHLSRLKTKWDYEPSVPRCELCVQYQRPGTFLRASLPVETAPRCKAGGFAVKPHAVCDRWKSASGETLARGAM